MKKQHRQSKRKLFDPDKIATSISQAIRRDFRQAQHEYCLNEDTVAYAFNRQVSDILKKYCSPSQDKESLQAQAFQKFLEVNEHMRLTNEKFRKESAQWPCRIQGSTPMDIRVHLRAKHLISQVLGSFDLEEMYINTKNSGGSSVGVPYVDTSMERKCTYPLSVTTRAKPLMVDYLHWDKDFSDAIESYNCNQPLADRYRHVKGSRATTVDKTTEKRRFICVEPTCNMFLQQGLMQMFYERLAKVGLDVTVLPERHKEKAKLGSISCNIATVDFSHASDCVSIELLRWLLPSAWFDIVWDLRCDSSKVFEGTPLHMISTMGNAVTFPLETLAFWAYAMATVYTYTYKTSTTMFPRWDHHLESCSVFGDDCILPDQHAHNFMSIMEWSGFIVNREKSFTGPLRFRESCGGDYLAGYDVRPFHLKAPSSTAKSALEPWLYIILNALVEKYILYFGELSYMYDKELFRCIERLFVENRLKLKLVPHAFPDDAGLKMLTYDIARLHRHYPAIELNRIDRSKQGTYCFQFCNFQYWKKRDRDSFIRYANELKIKCQPSDVLDEWFEPKLRILREPKLKFPVRKKGGYVVGKSYTAHWTVPVVKSGPRT